MFDSAAVFIGFKTGCSDGMQFLNGNLYYGNIQSSELGYVTDVLTYSQTSYGNLPSQMSASSVSTLNWIDTFSTNPNNSNSLYITSNKLNLFFSNAMDFTGQSGPNFHIYEVLLPTSEGSPSSTTSTLLVSPAGIFGLSCFGFLALVSLRFRIALQSHKPIYQSSTRQVDSELATHWSLLLMAGK